MRPDQMRKTVDQCRRLVDQVSGIVSEYADRIESPGDSFECPPGRKEWLWLARLSLAEVRNYAYVIHLVAASGNISTASRTLGVNRSTIYNFLKKGVDLTGVQVVELDLLFRKARGYAS